MNDTYHEHVFSWRFEGQQEWWGFEFADESALGWPEGHPFLKGFKGEFVAEARDANYFDAQLRAFALANGAQPIPNWPKGPDSLRVQIAEMFDYAGGADWRWCAPDDGLEWADEVLALLRKEITVTLLVERQRIAALIDEEFAFARGQDATETLEELKGEVLNG